MVVYSVKAAFKWWCVVLKAAFKWWCVVLKAVFINGGM